MLRGRHYLALACAVALLTAPTFAAATPAKQGSTKAASQSHGPSRVRTKALLSFQKDLVSVLAPQADALPLLAAALLARPLLDQSKYGSFASLIERAAQADDAGPAVSWVRLADCDAQADTCPNSSALEKLQTQAADNAAVWLLKLGEDTRNSKPDAAREDLAKAAASSVYDDYTGISLKALAGSVGVLPPPATTWDPANKAGAYGVQAVLVYGLANTQPQPGLAITAQLCEKASDDASIKTDCLKLSKTLEWGSSPLARSLGLHLREVLADDPTQQEAAKQARRNLIWQVHNFAQLSARVPNDKALAQHMLGLAHNGGTEMTLLLAALRDNHIPTEAPADWQPKAAK
ncbi:MAG: hypothetical protein ABI114_12750 [Rhodanobacter sp.]